MSDTANNHWLYQHLALPDSALLQARVYKKQLLEHADLTITDRRWVNDDIETIEWRYTLKPSTIAIPKYEDVDREYLEIAVLHITLKSATHPKRLAEVIQRSIPYPLLIVFEHSESIYINLADKRINRSDSSKLTVETFFDSGWMSKQDIELSAIHRQFIESLGFGQQNHHDLYSFYQSWIASFNAFEAAKRIGQFTLSNDLEADKLRQQHLQNIKAIELQLVTFKAQLKNESQFNRKVEINMQIKDLKQRIRLITTQLAA